jgi:ubiquinone/menaquinone biosynthesis C-methylase UbiE
MKMTFPDAIERYRRALRARGLSLESQKLSVLRALRRLLKPGGRMAFITIHTPPSLDAADRKRARRYGPHLVNSSRDYASLLEHAGFHDVRATDITSEYLRISRGWKRARDKYQSELRAALGDVRVREMESDSRLNLEGVQKGLLRRSIFVAVM